MAISLKGHLYVEVVRILSDNLAYLLWKEGERGAICIDPGESRPLLACASRQGVEINSVLLTHHHADHIAGARDFHCDVIGPSDSRMDVDRTVEDGERFLLHGVEIEVIATPGHTRSHLVYYLPAGGALFTGDTLFSGGCGRLFEGSAEEMWQSLCRIAQLPEETKIFCGHDYIEENFRFAKSVGIEKPSTIPSTLGQELEVNPFLRPLDPDFLQGRVASDLFSELRRQKDQSGRL